MRIHATLPGNALKNKKKIQDYKNLSNLQNSMNYLLTINKGDFACLQEVSSPNRTFMLGRGFCFCINNRLF